MSGANHRDHPAIEVRDLVRMYGDLRAVDHLSLQVNRGEVFGLLGPNGAGKTTTILMMCGLLKPTSGEIFIKGQPVRPGRIPELKSGVGICPQENILWNKLTCFEQLVFSARIYDVPSGQARERADRYLKKMGLGYKRDKLALTLSGGLKRRLSVIMAMMHDPDILVFDEPEAGLDPQSRVMVREFILETARDKTVIVTTHNMDEADRLATRVAIIDSGRLLRIDTPEMLKRSIGEGDVMEMKVHFPHPAALAAAREKLLAMDPDLHLDDNTIHLRAIDLVQGIHEIYLLLEKEGITVQEMKLRENTLEDVFIHLTGKSLRT